MGTKKVTSGQTIAEREEHLLRTLNFLKYRFEWIEKNAVEARLKTAATNVDHASLKGKKDAKAETLAQIKRQTIVECNREIMKYLLHVVGDKEEIEWCATLFEESLKPMTKTVVESLNISFFIQALRGHGCPTDQAIKATAVWLDKSDKTIKKANYFSDLITHKRSFLKGDVDAEIISCYFSEEMMALIETHRDKPFPKAPRFKKAYEAFNALQKAVDRHRAPGN